MSAAPRSVLILGLDTFAAKNCYQIKGMNNLGWMFIVATNDSRGDSRDVFLRSNIQNLNTLFLLPSGIAKVAAAFQLLLRARFRWHCHHVELYPGGRLGALYAAIAKLLRLKLLVVERGDIGVMTDHPPMTRFSLHVSYKLADFIWYKEPFMRSLLLRTTRAPLRLLPNTCEVPEDVTVDGRDIDFLWANRLIPQRDGVLFVEALNSPSLYGTSNVLAGMQKPALIGDAIRSIQERILQIRPANLTVKGWVDPVPLMQRARFFVLSGEHVFGNHAVLEAMARGVVPLVSRSDGVEELVTDGKNGFIFERTLGDMISVMQRALAVSEDERRKMSLAARETVLKDFGHSAWLNRLAKLYGESGAQPL